MSDLGRPGRWTALAVLILALAGAWSCGDLLQEPDTGIATVVTMTRVSGNGQTGPPGSPLPHPVRVQLDAVGLSTERLWVEWTVLEGGGTVQPQHSFTDGEGIAEAIWILGPGPGRQRIMARFAYETEIFEAQTAGD